MGIDCEIIKLPNFVSADAICDIIEEYNNDNSIHGIMVQLPLPHDLLKDTRKIVDSISVSKDVDGLTSAGRENLLLNLLKYMTYGIWTFLFHLLFMVFFIS